MIGDMSPPPPPPANNIDLQFISAMLATLSDPAASLKLLGEMQSARLQWVAAQDAAITAMRESDEHVAANRVTIAKEREEHDAAIAKERAECARRCALDMEEVRATRAETDRLHTQATGNANAAAALRERYERRIELMQQADKI